MVEEGNKSKLLSSTRRSFLRIVCSLTLSVALKVSSFTVLYFIQENTITKQQKTKAILTISLNLQKIKLKLIHIKNASKLTTNFKAF
jgi:hypothetical protein